MAKLTQKEIDLIGTSQQVIRIKLASGKSQQFPGYGNRYYCKELYDAATFDGVADIEIQTDVTGRRPLNIGMGERVPEGSYYETLTLFNPSTNPDVYVEVYSGFGDIIDNRLNIVRLRPASIQPVTDSPTDTIALPALVALANSIAGGATVSLSASPPPGYSQRRGFTVANADPNSPLQVVDDNGNVIGLVFAETTQVYYFSGAAGIKNATSVAITAYVGEIWYVQPGA